MPERFRIAFQRRIVVLPTASLLPRKTVPDRLKRTSKYKRIASSVAEVGIVEPLVVARMKKRDNRYLLLDGHLRFAVLTDLGMTNVRCLIADDDKSFTYNKRVNRLATVQENLTLLRALKRGVSERKTSKSSECRHQPHKKAP